MTETAGFRVTACDDELCAAPRLVISCTGCDSEETMNDEGGGCGLGDLDAWAAGHRCRRPLSYVSAGDLLTPVDESVSLYPRRPHRRSSLGSVMLPERPRTGNETATIRPVRTPPPPDPRHHSGSGGSTTAAAGARPSAAPPPRTASPGSPPVPTPPR